MTEANDRAAASPTDPEVGNVADRTTRRRRAAIAGHQGDHGTARALLTDADPGVRATALGALVRTGAVTLADASAAAEDPDPGVRRRLAELLPSIDANTSSSTATRTTGPNPADGPDVDLAARVLALLDDADDLVVDAAAWSAGELWEATEDSAACPPKVVAALAALVYDHDDALVRESAVAALGSIGHPAGRAAILHACADKATVRRRAILALAPFDGPDVDAAIEHAKTDRDWQVRQAGEDLSP